MQDRLANPPTKIRIIDGAINTVHTLPKTVFSQEHIEILEVYIHQAVTSYIPHLIQFSKPLNEGDIYKYFSFQSLNIHHFVIIKRIKMTIFYEFIL